MNYLYDLITNKPLVCAVAGWFTAQVIKMIITAVIEKTVDLGRLLAPGGMPSSHSAFVTSLSATIGMQYGFGSVYFSLAAALALVVMYDACGVRRAVGEQAKVLNSILGRMKEGSSLTDEEVVREILGHTPLQVAIGFLLGVAISLVSALVW